MNRTILSFMMPKRKQLVLHKGAQISYEDIKINSDYIVYDQDSNRLTALQIDSVQQSRDSTVSPSKLAQGSESSTFTALQYNFKSKRALVENAYSQYGEGFILSQQVKRTMIKPLMVLRIFIPLVMTLILISALLHDG